MKFSIYLKNTVLITLLFALNSIKSNGQTEKKRSVFVKKIDQNILLDGVLDEDIWDQAEIVTDFWQMFPTDSLQSRNETIVKLLYDDTNLYIGSFSKGIGPNFRVSSLKRDFSARSNDNVTVLFDTFRDGQNAFLFGVNALGVQREGLISDGGTAVSGFSLTWDIKWQTASTRKDDSFTIEIIIPLNSLKYPEGVKKWGISSLSI